MIVKLIDDELLHDFITISAQYDYYKLLSRCYDTPQRHPKKLKELFKFSEIKDIVGNEKYFALASQKWLDENKITFEEFEEYYNNKGKHSRVINCWICEDCVDCIDCKFCYKCSQCNMVLSSKICKFCYECRRCEKCTGVAFTDDSFNCSDSDACDHCTRVVFSQQCWYCLNVEECNLCRHCENCISCKECDDCKNCVSCYNCKNCNDREGLSNKKNRGK